MEELRGSFFVGTQADVFVPLYRVFFRSRRNGQTCRISVDADGADEEDTAEVDTEEAAGTAVTRQGAVTGWFKVSCSVC
jgi:hypothetical protein